MKRPAAADSDRGHAAADSDRGKKQRSRGGCAVIPRGSASVVLKRPAASSEHEKADEAKPRSSELGALNPLVASSAEAVDVEALRHNIGVMSRIIYRVI